jgi:hypothetical protein
MPRFAAHWAQMAFGTEVLYSFIIIACSLIIYFSTKEMEELSSYKGIKYFRKAFLFFALAYFFRTLIKFILSFFSVPRILDYSPKLLGPLSLFLFMYFSALAIFYLLYSVMWKKLDTNGKGIYFFHLLAIIIAIVSILSRNPLIYLGIQLFLFIFIFAIVLISYKTSRGKNNNIYKIYLLLFIFWILNILDILVPNFLQTFQMLLYIISCGVFLSILYKVVKKTGST